MAVIAHLDLHLKPESLPGAHDTLRTILIDTRGFAGNLGVETLVDVNDPAHILVVEQWESMEHDSAYRAWRQTPEGAAGLGAILAAAPTLTWFAVEAGN